ncbi:MAG: hypothetical protein IPL63_07420 [Saprospiraceae bacterium]|nr:hypothetical protein [Saprospiraceae bacterium]
MIRPFNTVAFFEFEFHNEVLKAYVHHFLPISSKIIVFTNQFNYNQSRQWSNNPKITWIIETKKTGLHRLLDKHQEELVYCDIIILTSMPEVNNHEISIKFPCPAWLVIHNLHTSFGNVLQHYYIGKEWWKDMLKLIRYIFYHGNKATNTILNNVENIILPSENIREYFIKTFQDSRFPSPVIIPFNRFEKQVIPLKNEIFRMVVPGSITMYTRDYQLLYEAIKLVLSKTETKIFLTLLGKPRDHTCEKILAKIQQLTGENFTFQYFMEFVDQDVFDDILLQSNIILAPLQKETRYDVFKECYGYSTESGNIADIIRYGIPGIIPEYYPFPEEGAFLVKKYQNADSLSEAILHFIENDKNKNQFEELLYFCSEQVSKRILAQWEKTHSKMDTFGHDG